jgi:hypothetical protein
MAKLDATMKKIAIYILLAWLAMPCLAKNDIVQVSATYEYISSDKNETPAQAEANAFQAARRKALEDKFGIDVTAVTNTLTTSQNNEQAASTESNVFALSETAVRGEWIETISEQVIEKTFKDGFWIIKVRVEGRARSQAAEKADIRFAFLKDADDLDSPVTFRDGSDLFLRFQSPVAGYLCVYLVDEALNAYCLLPYMQQQTGSQAIEANREYLFFSEKYEKGAQEYTLTCERATEQNMLYIIFSPNDFTKAADKAGGKNFREEQLPRELSREAFLNWLSRNQTKDPQMLVRTELISIKKQ